MLVAYRARTSGLLERGHLVRTGIRRRPVRAAGILPAVDVVRSAAISENAGLDARAIPLVLALFGFLSCYVPANRAARVDPIRSLRAD